MTRMGDCACGMVARQGISSPVPASGGVGVEVNNNRLHGDGGVSDNQSDWHSALFTHTPVVEDC